MKFIRYGQHFIEKNGFGILAYINPHGFLDNSTFRGMRWNLLNTFDKIYTIDLHGNAKKKETALDGSKDENVFDIEQGVSINFFIKTGKKKENELATVFHLDLYGKRQDKYDFLINHSFLTSPYNFIESNSPNYFLRAKEFQNESNYITGFGITDLFKLNSLGLLTKRDNLSIDFNQQKLEQKIKYFLDPGKSVEEVCSYYNLIVKDNDKWDANISRSEVKVNEIKAQIKDVLYRPFDHRKVFYNQYFVARPNTKVLGQFIKNNLGLIICRQGQAVGGEEWNVVFMCVSLTDQNIYRRGGGTIFPLYLYPQTSGQLNLGASNSRTPNLNMEIVNHFAAGLGLSFVPEKVISSEARKLFAPIDLLDYIYAVLHSPNYRETYKEFLKIDFPRVPYPSDAEIFWKLVALGGELRQLHLMESPSASQLITQYPVGGENEVEKISFVLNGPDLPGFQNLAGLNLGRVFINSEQYFNSVPEIAWNFYIGGYQPAQKWLKDRKGRTLDFEDIMHYQRIIKVLTETERVMREIDEIKI